MPNITIKNSKPTSIKVITAPKNMVSINTRGAISRGGGGAGAELRNLIDVDASDVDNNETIVYDAERDKFVVENLPIMDGGEF